MNGYEPTHEECSIIEFSVIDLEVAQFQTVNLPSAVRSWYLSSLDKELSLGQSLSLKDRRLRLRSIPAGRDSMSGNPPM